jgi:hypothetical protein
MFIFLVNISNKIGIIDMELTFEEMRQLLQQFSKELSSTKGDASIVEQLKVLNKSMSKLEKLEKNSVNKNKKEIDESLEDFLTDFVKKLDEARVFKEINKSLKELNDKSNDTANQGNLDLDPKEFKSFTKSFASAAKSIFGYATAFGGSINKVTTDVLSMVDGLGHLDGTLSNFADAAHLPTAFKQLAKMADENVSAYRLLVESSEGTVKTFDDLRGAMHTSSLAADDFSKAIADGGRATALLGAQPWAQLYKSVKDSTATVNRYGYSANQLISVQNDYLDMVSSQGSILTATQDDLKKGLNNLLNVNTKQANILGLNRQDMLKAAAEQARDSNMQVFLQSQKNFNQTAINELLAGLNQIAPAAKDIFSEQLMYNGGFNNATDTAKVFAQLPPEAQKSFDDLQKFVQETGLQTNEQYTKAIELQQTIAKSIATEVDSTQKDMTGRFGTMQNEWAQKFNQLIVGAQNVRQTNVEDAAGLQNNATDGSNQQAATNALLQTDFTLQEIKGATNDALTEFFKPFEQYAPSMLELMKSTDELVKTFKDAITGMGTLTSSVAVLGGIFATLGAGGMLSKWVAKSVFKGFTTVAKAAGKSLAVPVLELAKTLSPKQAVTAASEIGKTVASTVENGLKPVASTVTEVAADASKATATAVKEASLLSKAANAGKTGLNTIKNVGSSILKDPANLAVIGAIAADAAMGTIGGYGQHNMNEQLNEGGLTKEKLNQQNWDKMSWWQKGISGAFRGSESALDLVGLSTMANEFKNTRVMAETILMNDEPSTEEIIDTSSRISKDDKDSVDTQMTALEITKEPLVELVDLAHKQLASLDVISDNLNNKPINAEIRIPNNLKDLMEPYTQQMLETNSVKPKENITQQTNNSTDSTVILNQIYQILKQNLDFDKINGELIRNQLESISNYNSTLVRRM